MKIPFPATDALEVSLSYSPNVFDEAYPLLYENSRLTSNFFNYVRYLSHLSALAAVRDRRRGVGKFPRRWLLVVRFADDRR
jgi:hypothetical protein